MKKATKKSVALGGSVWRSPRGRISIRWYPRITVVCAILAALAIALGCITMTHGTLPIGVPEVWAALLGQGEESVVRVVVGIRLPRVVTALVVGASLGIAGAVFQSLSRNALGSPDIIGFTTGSATGAIVQIIIFDGGPVAIALSAVGGGLVTALVVYILSFRGGATGGYRLILVGIGVGAILAAVNSLLLTRAQLDSAVSAQIWLTGTLNARTWVHAIPVLAFFAVLVPIIAATTRSLTLMEMGDDVAEQLGVRLEATRLTSLAAGVGLTAIATAAAGPISFVALAAPHLVKRLGGGVHPPLLASGFMGATLLIAADVASQYLPLGFSAPVGIMTGLIGGIYLLWLLSTSTRVLSRNGRL